MVVGAEEEQVGAPSRPLVGTYVGKRRDYSCPGDHATWEIVLMEDRMSTIKCKSELSLSKGGLQAWHVEGIWEWDDDDEEVVVTITKDDPLGGPKREREVKLPLGEDGSLTFRDVQCAWAKPPPDLIADQIAAMPLKELKAVALASRVDPAGCIEREDFERILMRARSSGTLNLKLELPAEAVRAPASGSEATGSPAPAGSPATPARGPAAPGAPPPNRPATASELAAAAGEPAAAPAAAVAAQEAEEGCYSLGQLQEKSIWEKLDVKSTERETYLPQAVFMQLFAMSKAEFGQLPKWKKDNLKKKHDLF